MPPETEPSAFDLTRLPAGLRSRGRPLSVHRPWKDALADVQRRLLARFLGEGARDVGSSPNIERAVMVVLGALTFCAGFVFVWAFYYRPPKNEDPRFLLIAAAATFVFGAVLVGLGLFHRPRGGEAGAGSKGPKPGAARHDLYLVYPDGLAAVTGGSFEFMAWNEVKEVSSVWVAMDRFVALTAADDRRIVIGNGYSNAGELRLAIHKNVNDVLLPKVLKTIAAGKTVKFGPFAINRGGLKYKDRKASWDDITSLKVDSHRGDTRLVIFVKGRLLRWSWCDVNTIPNWQTFYDALCRTAPGRLLTTSTKPRW